MTSERRTTSANQTAGDPDLFLRSGNTKPQSDEETPEQRRVRKSRENQARYRAKKRNMGDKEIRVTLTSMELFEFESAQAKSGLALEVFKVKALLLGAKFAANSTRKKG